MHSLITCQKPHGYESDQDHMNKSIEVKTSGIDLLPYVTNNYREIYSHTLNIYESWYLKGCKQELFIDYLTLHFNISAPKANPMFVLIQTHSARVRESTNYICILNLYKCNATLSRPIIFSIIFVIVG